jgi:hypothetical protein
MGDGMEVEQYMKFRNTLPCEWISVPIPTNRIRINRFTQSYRSPVSQPSTEMASTHAMEHLYWQAAEKITRTKVFSAQRV